MQKTIVPQGGRGHWTVYYTCFTHGYFVGSKTIGILISTQSFIATVVQKLFGTFIEFRLFGF